MLNSMLYETAMDMQTPNEMSFDTTNVHSFAMMQNSEMGRPGVGSVNDMLASSRPSAAHEMVQVAQVPDFSELMDKMIEKGVM